MCGIFGSTSFDTYEKLFTANRVRGNFASGSLYVAPTDLYIRRDGRDYCMSGERVWNSIHDYTLFLGHTQAPTGSFRQWSSSTTHPFDIGYWIVAHNGVLENHHSLIEEYCPDHTNSVDSSIIPALLEERYVGDDIYCISEVANLLKGTFACWIFSKHTRQSYIIRSGSTLFQSPTSCTFSSIPIEGVCEDVAEEGVIYQLTTEGSTQVGAFVSDSPFLIL